MKVNPPTRAHVTSALVRSRVHFTRGSRGIESLQPHSRSPRSGRAVSRRALIHPSIVVRSFVRQVFRQVEASHRSRRRRDRGGRPRTITLTIRDSTRTHTHTHARTICLYVVSFTHRRPSRTSSRTQSAWCGLGMSTSHHSKHHTSSSTPSSSSNSRDRDRVRRRRRRTSERARPRRRRERWRRRRRRCVRYVANKTCQRVRYVIRARPTSMVTRARMGENA